MFFDRMPKALTLYEAFAARLRSELDHVTVKVQKTQISFSNKYNFAFISLPIRKMKGRPDVYMIVSFGLGYQMEDKRIAAATEPYPNRWTHHIIIQNISEIDDQLMGWIKQAYAFSLYK
jgi:predicted transport protein